MVESALGHKWTSQPVRPTSALPPKAGMVYRQETEVQLVRKLAQVRNFGRCTHAGVAMWSRLLALALLLLPAPALAGVKEKITALAPSGVVLVVDSEGNELVAQKTDEPFVPASVTKIVTAWLERRAHQVSGPPTRSLRSPRSEEHTSELPSLTNLACRLLLETNT